LLRTGANVGFLLGGLERDSRDCPIAVIVLLGVYERDIGCVIIKIEPQDRRLG
jgi:hypothetical protein